MTITHMQDLAGLQAIGRIVANTMQAMARAMDPGMTTGELDAMGRAFLQREGAEPAPAATYGFPDAPCISMNKVIAHSLPGRRVPATGIW